jgi:hypothetical protein
MALKIQQSTLQGVSKKTHPEVFRGIEEIASDFPDGWDVHLIPGYNTSLEIKLTAQGHHLLRDEEQTAEGTKNVLRDLRKSLIA